MVETRLAERAGDSLPERSRLSDRHRVLAAVLAVGLLLPLGLAAWLEPAAERHGTHQQLGLPPCTLRYVFGLRCPTCGMTTSWAALVRGRLGEAVRANVAGTLLGVLDPVAACWLLASAVRGRWLGGMAGSGAWAWIAVAIAAVALVDWIVRLAV